jgi:DNA modification methylase
MEVDLFGNVIEKKVLLRETFIEPPFSVIDSKSGTWQARKRKWKNLGIKSEVGRDAVSIHIGTKANSDEGSEYTSIFDPALCELMYRWFCPEGGSILDPFAGGSVRGIVANYLGYKYTGIDIRQEQIESNIEQGKEILGDDICEWITGDSNKVLDSISNNQFDMVFSCPPYADLEVYSDLDGDISNMDYPHFIDAYRSIIKKSIDKLVGGGYAVFVVGEVRGKNGSYLGFVPDTIKAFMDCGMQYYNEAVLLTPIASASMRANGNMKSKKLVKVHQNILIFKKP